MTKLHNFKILKTFTNDGKKFQIIQANSIKKIIKLFNKKKDGFKFSNELNGYKFYSKNKYFKIPKLYEYSFKEKKLVLEYINGKKVHPLHFKKIIKKIDRNKVSKTNISKYLNKLKKNYLFSNYSNIYFKKIKKLFPENDEILISYTHGDFSNYNCLKDNKYFYVLDFEKFSKRIVLFDNLNWYLLYIYFNIAKLFNKKISNHFIQILFFIVIKLINILIKNINKEHIKYHKINPKSFNTYLLLYYFEKILILEIDYKNIVKQKNKRITKNLIYILKKNLEIIINEYKK